MGLSLGVLSKRKDYFPTEALLTEVNRRNGVLGIHLSTQFITPFLDTSSAKALYANRSLKGLDGIIPRIGRSQTELGLICLKQFELMGIPSTLSAHALFLARDKFRCFQALSTIPGIKIPKTLLISHIYLFNKLVESFKFPTVIKVPNATQGMGTILAPNRKIAQEIVESLFLRYNEPVLIQEYLSGINTKSGESNEDIRVLIVGDKILGAIRRVAPKGEWRTNYARGAKCVTYKLSRDVEELVFQVKERIGVEVAGIDLYPTTDGVYLLEVNACPGWKAFEQAHPHIHVAKYIIDYLLTKIHH